MPEMYSFWWWVLFVLIWQFSAVIPCLLFFLTTTRRLEVSSHAPWIVLNTMWIGPMAGILFTILLLEEGTFISKMKELVIEPRRERIQIRKALEESLEKKRKKEEKRYSVETTHKRQIRLPAKTGWRKYI